MFVACSSSSGLERSIIAFGWGSLGVKLGGGGNICPTPRHLQISKEADWHIKKRMPAVVLNKCARKNSVVFQRLGNEILIFSESVVRKSIPTPLQGRAWKTLAPTKSNFLHLSNCVLERSSGDSACGYWCVIWKSATTESPYSDLLLNTLHLTRISKNPSFPSQRLQGLIERKVEAHLLYA